jgi:hypothetical protein
MTVLPFNFVLKEFRNKYRFIEYEFKNLFTVTAYSAHHSNSVNINVCNETNLMHFSLFSYYTSTCFGLASSPSSGGNTVYRVFTKEWCGFKS